MNKNRKTSHILNVFQFDANGHVILPATLTIGENPHSSDNTSKIPSTSWIRTYVTGLSYLTGNQSITVSGDATGSGTTAITLTLANTAVTPGTYGSTTLVPVVTVDSKGRITSVTTAAISGSLTFTGDVTGTGTTGTSTGLTLAASGVTAGTYTKVTVDSKGRVTVGANASTTDISEGTNLYYTDTRVGTYLTANSYATQSYVGTQIANLVASAPATLDTLNELSVALGNDPNFATSVATSIGTKQAQLNGTGFVKMVGTTVSYDNNTYLTSFTETDPTVPSHVKSITTTEKANWNTAYGWGNHASGGYLTGITSSQVTTALGYTPYNSTNPSGYITGITSSNVTTALGYTPYNSTNPSGYITGITSGNVTTALGYTPYNSTNPSGYITTSSLTWSNISGKPTALSSFTNDLGNYGGWITGYTETDTLASVTGRGATTSNAVTVGLLIAQGPGGNYNENVRLPGSTAVISFNTSGATGAGSYNIVSQTNFQIRNANGSQVFIMDQSGNLTMTGTVSGSNLSGTNTGDQTNISGTAGSISGYNNPTTAATANTIAYRDSGGDLYARYMFAVHFNQSGGNSENPTIGQIWTQNTTDNYVRKSTPAHFRSQVTDGVYVYARGQSNWNDSTVIGNAVGMLTWKNYGNAHVIFDASQGTSPSGGGVSQTNATYEWSASYPTLMGWNGSNTYGVRVDSARIADSASSVAWGNVSGRPTAVSSFTNDSGYLTSVGIGNMTDVHRLFNNMGNSHGTYQDFNSVGNFGVRYMQGSTNGPQTGQFYGFTLGLGNDYGIGNYGSQFYWMRNTTNPYIWIRYLEGGSWGGWTKGAAGYSDSAGSLSSMNISQFTNNSGYVTSSHQHDTLYYNGTAHLWTGSDGTRNMGWAYHNNNGTGLHWPNNGWHIYPINASDMYIRSGASDCSLKFTKSGTSGSYIHCAADNAIGFLTTGRSWSLRVDDSGGGTFYGGLTVKNAIYLDANEDLYLNYNYGCSIVGVYASTRYQGIFSMGNSWKLARDGTTPGNLYGLSWSHPNAGGQAGYLSTHGLLVMENGTCNTALANGIWTRGDVTAYSDARVKDNVEVIENAIEKIKAIRGVTFTRNDREDTTKRFAGVIAQEVLEVLPEVVTEDALGTYSVAYGNLNALLIEAIKEQQKEIDELKSLINGLTK